MISKRFIKIKINSVIGCKNNYEGLIRRFKIANPFCEDLVKFTFLDTNISQINWHL